MGEHEGNDALSGLVQAASLGDQIAYIILHHATKFPGGVAVLNLIGLIHC